MSGIKGAKEAAAYIREWRKTFAGGVKSVNKSEATSDSEDLLSMTNFEIALGRMALASEFMADSISKGVSSFPNPRKWVIDYNKSSKSQATNDEVEGQVQSLELVVSGAQELVVQNPEIGEADKAQQTKAQTYFLAKMFSEFVKKLPSGVKLKSKLPKMPEAPKLPNLSRDAINDRIGKWALKTALNLLAQMERKSKLTKLTDGPAQLTDGPAQEAAPTQKSKGPASKAREGVADAGARAKAGLNTIAKHMKECAEAVRQATPGPREAASAAGTGGRAVGKGLLIALLKVALLSEYLGDVGVKGIIYDVKRWLRSHVGRSGNKSETSTSKAEERQEQSIALVVRGFEIVESEVKDPTQKAEAKALFTLKVAEMLAANTRGRIMSLMPSVKLPPMPSIVIPQASIASLDKMSSETAAKVAAEVEKTYTNADLGISDRPTVPTTRRSPEALEKSAQFAQEVKEKSAQKRRAAAKSANKPLVPPRPGATKSTPPVPGNRPAPITYEALVQELKSDPERFQIVQGKLLNPLGTDNIIRSELLRIGAGFSEKEVDVIMGNMQQFREDMGVPIQERRERADALVGEKLVSEIAQERRERADALVGEELVSEVEQERRERAYGITGRGKAGLQQWIEDSLKVAKQHASSAANSVLSALSKFYKEIERPMPDPKEIDAKRYGDALGNQAKMLLQFEKHGQSEAEEKELLHYKELFFKIEQALVEQAEKVKKENKPNQYLSFEAKEFIRVLQLFKKDLEAKERTPNLLIVGPRLDKFYAYRIAKLVVEMLKNNEPGFAELLPALPPRREEISELTVKRPMLQQVNDAFSRWIEKANNLIQKAAPSLKSGENKPPKAGKKPE